MTSYEPHYEGSAVVSGPLGGRSSAHGTHSFAARPGHHLSPQGLTDGHNVFEELGAGFTLLAFDDTAATAEKFDAAARALRMPFKVVRDSLADGRTAYGARLILVRPDQYVAWTGDEAPEDARQVLATAVGRA